MPPPPLDTDLDGCRPRFGSENLMTLLYRRTGHRDPPVAAAARPDGEWSMDIMSAAQRSKLMSRIQSKDTAPELALRRLLHAAGYRFRLHGALPPRQLAVLRRQHQGITWRGGKLPGSPDLVFSARHKVIFVNGCFWHGHGCPVGQHRPASNTDYWNPKLDANIARDQRNRRDLETIGWESLTLWECELKSMDDILRRTASFLGPARILPRRGTPTDPPQGNSDGYFRIVHLYRECYCLLQPDAGFSENCPQRP